MGRRDEMVAREISESIVGDFNKVIILRNLRGGTINLSQLPNEWKEYVDEKFCAQSELFRSLSEEAQQIVYSAVVSGMENVATKIAHEQCLHDKNIESVENIAVSLDEMKQHEEEVFDNILNILNQGQIETSKRIAALQELNERLQFDTRKTLECCDEIITEIRFANERIGKLTTLAEENQDAIANLKEIVLSYIRLAEKHHEESQLILATQDKRLSSPGLDEQTILAMRVWFDQISQDLSDNSKDQNKIKESITNQREILENKLNTVQDSLKELGKLINEYGTANGKKLEDIKETLSQKAKEILQREAEIYDLALDTNQTTHQAYEKAQEILDYLKGIRVPIAALEEISREVLQNTNGPEKEKLNEKIGELQQIANELELQLQIAMQKGEAVKEACPYCGYVELRGVVGDMCQCDCCGKTFNRENENKKKVDSWREKHTAILENVTNEEKQCLCRMQLEGDTVSNKGVLIIPSPSKAPKDKWFGYIPAPPDNKIRLAFCQPNIDDEVGWERMRRIKTLILPNNMILTDFNDTFPFSEGIDDLEKVLQFNEEMNACVEDVETLRRIKNKGSASKEDIR